MAQVIQYRPRWRPVASPPVRLADVRLPDIGGGAIIALAAVCALPLALAAVTWLARPPAPAPAAKTDRNPIVQLRAQAEQIVPADAVQTVQPVIFRQQAGFRPSADGAQTQPSSRLPTAKLRYDRPRPRTRPTGLCARHGLRQRKSADRADHMDQADQVWYGAYWRCRR